VSGRGWTKTERGERGHSIGKVIGYWGTDEGEVVCTAEGRKVSRKREKLQTSGNRWVLQKAYPGRKTNKTQKRRSRLDQHEGGMRKKPETSKE